jgi:L-fuconolactonase
VSTLSLLDAHVHLWEPDRFEYEWLESFPRLNQSHNLDDYTEATGEVDVDEFVFVECTESFDDRVARKEVQWVQSLAERDERIRGIVAHASLEKGGASREHLDWLAEQPLVTGIRRIVQDDPPEFLVDSDLVEGIRLLSDYGFSFDLTVTAGQLEHAIELVDRCPKVQFVLDHLGKPAIREGRLDPWRTHLERLAEREHVVCKLSGVLTEADLEEWATADVAPFIEHALECFGPDRLLFGGDWPVLRLAADYSTWVDLVETSIQSYSDIEQQKILRETARRVYDLA